MAADLAYAAAALTTAWGVAHLVPTRKVVSGFGTVSEDSRLIITMEWLAEGLALVFLGALVALVTLRGSPSDPVTVGVYGLTAGMLAVMAALTAATAARGTIVFFKICPHRQDHRRADAHRQHRPVNQHAGFGSRRIVGCALAGESGGTWQTRRT